MRSFELARKIVENVTVDGDGNEVKIKEIAVDENGKELLAYPEAQIPEYQTKYSAGADFFCAEAVVIPSVWKLALSSLASKTGAKVEAFADTIFESLGYKKEEDSKKELIDIKPTLVHTGIKSNMEDDEVLELYNRSSNPGKKGLILANSVGVIDKDFYNNPDDDGEIKFAFYNFKLWDVKLEVGERIGQGVFKKFLRPEIGLRVKDIERTGGIGSTNK